MGRRAKTIFMRMDLELADESRLPPRRGQVLRLAACGLSSECIAEELGISANTVDWHLNELKDQFCAFSRADLISQGWMHGLLRAKSAIRACVFVLAVFSSYQMSPARTTRPVRNGKIATYYRLSRSETAAS